MALARLLNSSAATRTADAPTAERLKLEHPQAEYFPASGAVRMWRDRTLRGKLARARQKFGLAYGLGPRIVRLRHDQRAGAKSTLNARVALRLARNGDFCVNEGLA